MTVKSVGEAANDMVRECNRQFPLIMQGGAPDYNQCIMISTQASLREMILPGALVIFSPILFGIGEGKGKKSEAHKNAVVGDTVGDPLKDTSGPSLNIVVKLSAITALVFGSVIKAQSNQSCGPKWVNPAALSGNTPLF